MCMFFMRERETIRDGGSFHRPDSLLQIGESGCHRISFPRNFHAMTVAGNLFCKKSFPSGKPINLLPELR